MPVEMIVHGVGKTPDSDALLVLLKEPAHERYLAIAVGALEIAAIAAALAHARPPRPMTHDLLCSAIAATGAVVTQAVVHALISGVFHARLVLDVAGRHVELDARASDAIAIAVRLNLPVIVDEAVLDQAAVEPRPDSSSSASPDRIREEQLGAFRDVIRGLNLDDLGRSG